MPPLSLHLKDSDIISYAYLFKKLMFATKFKRRDFAQFEFNGKMVKSFYGDKEEQKKQVLVHSYKDESEFMVQIKGKNKNDSLFLIKNKKVKTVDHAIKMVV